MDAKKYALVDIHLHLDGSLTVDDVRRMAEMSGQALPADDEQLRQALQCPPSCGSLGEYLRCFELPIALMQRREAIELAAKNLVCRLDGQGLLYAEVKVGLQLLTHRGMTQEQVVESALKGLRDGMEACGHRFRANLVLGCMRGDGNERENIETVLLAKQFLGRGVCAVDLVGDEARYPTRNFSDVFSRAARLGVPISIHAGEARGVDSIMEALDMGATMIGHGIQAHNDEAMLRLLCDRDVCLTFCPTSNFDTRVLPVRDYARYPIRPFLEHGVAVCINTDNMTVSRTTLRDEIARLAAAGVVAEDDLKKMTFDAITHSFASEALKQELLRLAAARMA